MDKSSDSIQSHSYVTLSSIFKVFVAEAQFVNIFFGTNVDKQNTKTVSTLVPHRHHIVTYLKIKI